MVLRHCWSRKPTRWRLPESASRAIARHAEATSCTRLMPGLLVFGVCGSSRVVPYLAGIATPLSPPYRPADPRSERSGTPARHPSSQIGWITALRGQQFATISQDGGTAARRDGPGAGRRDGGRRRRRGGGPRAGRRARGHRAGWRLSLRTSCRTVETTQSGFCRIWVAVNDSRVQPASCKSAATSRSRSKPACCACVV